MANGDDIFPFSPLFDEYDEYMEYLNAARLSRLRQEIRQNQASSIPRETHFVERIGKYVTPPDTTWQSYSNTVRHCGLDFDPQSHIFDKAVALSSKNRAIGDPAARHYADYEPLRHNLAVIRNFVLNHIYGLEIDTEEAKDEQKFSYVVQIGNEIGVMLRRGNNPLLGNPLGARVTPKDANVEYDGAVRIYKKLRSMQTSNRLLAPLDYLVNMWRPRYLDQNWKLPPIELTPFGRLNYYAPPPTDNIATTDTLLATDALEQAAAVGKAHSGTIAMDAVGTTLADKAARYNDVEALAQPVKIQAIEIARDILEKLKIQFQGTPVMAMLDYTTSHFQRTIADVNAAIAVYEDHLHRAVMLDPSLREDPMIVRANDAVGFLGTQIKLRALDRAEITGNTEHADIIRSELDKLPARWVNPNSFTSAEALSAIDNGIQMVLATLLMIQQEQMGQNQRNLMLQASLSDPQEQIRRMDSLAFDETYQRLIQERQRQFHTQLGGHGGKQGAGMQDSKTTPTEKKTSARNSYNTGLLINTTTPAGAPTSFDSLLSGSGANLQQMQSSMNTPTSGNFAATAPSTIQQVIAQHIRTNTGVAGATGTGARQASQRDERQKRRQAERTEQEQKQQVQTRAAERRTQEKQARAQEREAAKNKEETPSGFPNGHKRDRNPLGR